MKDLVNDTRDIARELARKYSTMTHDELDVLESILVPMKFTKSFIFLSFLITLTLIQLQYGKECFLWNLYVSNLFHTFLTFLLLL